MSDGRRFGTHRTVYLTKRYAFKVPVFVEWRLFLLGLLANMQEAQFSKAGWLELCPVVFSVRGGFLNVMRRAKPLDAETYWQLNYSTFVNRPHYVVPVEDKLDSFGVLDGRVVAVDYGS